jgi:hypothetical protein
MRRTVAFTAGLVVAFGATIVAMRLASSLSGESSSWQTRSAEEEAPRVVLPEPDIQEVGPFPGTGERLSLDEAMQETTYELPVPPSDERTGQLSGIWIDRTIAPAPAIAFLWETDLRLYVYVSDRTEAQAVAEWTSMIKEGDGTWTLTTARGHPAIGANLAGVQPTSSLAFIERGLDISIGSPNHTLSDLQQLVGDIRYEGETHQEPSPSPTSPL